MNPKQESEQSSKLSTVTSINKKMLELKKKIQLSEGQRKALFEECEAERKLNADEIIKLKKEISQLVVQHHECQSITANLKLQNKRLEAIIGPIDDKTGREIEELLDLHIVDKSKQLNLLRYRIKQKQKFLLQLQEEHQILCSEKDKKEVLEKIDKPFNESVFDLQNKIHAVEIQMREANHIRTRYKDIKKSLEEDSAKFESNIQKLQEELQAQEDDIKNLQNIMDQAIRMRSEARGRLLQEERAAMASANTRDRQTIEGKRLMSNRKHELEQLEKRIFQSGKIAARSEPDGAEDAGPGTDEETPKSSSTPPKNDLSENFEILKRATGGTSSEDVLNRFTLQKDTYARLVQLRKNTENEKKMLDKQMESLNSELQRYKYAEVKDGDRKAFQIEVIEKAIEEQRERACKYKELKAEQDSSTQTILKGLQKLHLNINPMAVLENDPLLTLDQIKTELVDILEKIDQKDILINKEELEEGDKVASNIDEKWLPSPYSGFVRRFPLPQQGVPPAPAASEDEEEVPSRSFLKRQAQLVIDAKSRRKIMRLQQLPKGV